MFHVKQLAHLQKVGFFGIIGQRGLSMTLFNYKDYLRLDDATYKDWEPFLQRQEEQATAHAKDLNPALNESADNSLLERYCEEFIYLALYGEDINGNLLKMHMDRMANFEEQFRYGLGG